MPIIKRGTKYYWGNQGPFTREKAEEVQRAAYASGYTGKAIQNLTQFVQKAEEDDGIEGFRRHMGDEIQRQVDKNRPHTEWEDTHPDLFLPVGHDKAPLFLENKGEGRSEPSVHYHAYNYVDKIHRDVPLTANQHADGLKQVHRSDMLQRHGDAVRDMDYDDAFPLGRARPNIPPRNAPKGQRPSQAYLDTTRKEMNIHDFLTDHTESMLSKVPSQHQEGVQRMFDKVAFESPSYKPTGSFETDPDIQQYFAIEQSLRKDVSRFTPEELNQLEADEGVRFTREALETPRGAIPQAGRQARPYARPVGIDPDTDLSSHAYGADEVVGPMGENRYTGKGMRAEFPSWSQDYGPTPQEWNAISQPDTPEERWSREKRIGMMSRQEPQSHPYDEDSYSPSEWANRNPKKAVQKLLQFLRKADEEPEYHPVTGRRMAPRQESTSLRGGGMLDYGEIEQTTFPKINTYIDEPQEERVVTRGIAPGYGQNHSVPVRRFPAKQPSFYSHPEKGWNIIQDAERKHDYVDEIRADPNLQRYDKDFSARRGESSSHGAFHNSDIHKILDELYGRSPYRIGAEPMHPYQRGRGTGEPSTLPPYVDKLSVHPHNEIIDRTGGAGKNAAYHPESGDIFSTNRTDHHILRPPTSPEGHYGEGSSTDYHHAFFGDPNEWAWNQHGLYRRMLRRGERMRFSSHMLGHALGAEAINARNKVPYGFNSHGERISPATHDRDLEPSADSVRDGVGPVRWADEARDIIENKPLLSYVMPQSRHDDPTRAGREIYIHYYDPEQHSVHRIFGEKGEARRMIRVKGPGRAGTGAPGTTPGDYSRGEIFSNSAGSHEEAIANLMEHLRDEEWFNADGTPASNPRKIENLKRHQFEVIPEYMHHDYGKYPVTSMNELDDLGPLTIHDFHQLIENREGWHRPGEAAGYTSHPATKVDFPQVEPDRSRPFIGATPTHWGSEGRRFPQPTHLRSGNFMPKQDILSREAQLQYHQRLASLWNAEEPLEQSPSGGRHVPGRRIDYRRDDSSKIIKSVPLLKAGYFLNPGDPFGQNNPWKFDQASKKWQKPRREDVASEGGGQYGEGVRDILSTPKISSDPMAEFARRGQRRASEPSTFRPYGTPPVDPEAWEHVQEGGKMIPVDQAFNPNILRRPANPEHHHMGPPLPGGKTLAFSPLHYDNYEGAHNKRAFDTYTQKLAKGVPLSWHEHWEGLQHGVDYHNHTAEGINKYLAEKKYHDKGQTGGDTPYQGETAYEGNDTVLFANPESEAYPHIITNRLRFPRINTDRENQKAVVNHIPAESIPQGFMEDSGVAAYEKEKEAKSHADFIDWHYNGATQPPSGVKAAYPPYRRGMEAYWGTQAGGSMRLLTLPEFLHMSQPTGTAPLEGHTPLTINDTGKSLHSSTTGVHNPDWDKLQEARWAAWMDLLTHVTNTWDSQADPNSLQLADYLSNPDDEEVDPEDALDESAAENRREYLRGNRDFRRYGPVDHKKEKGTPENPRNVLEHWQEGTSASKHLSARGYGGLPRQFPTQREGGLSGPVNDSSTYGTRSQYNLDTLPVWREVIPSSERERARMGMENSLRKEGDGGGDGGAFNGLSDTVFTSTNAGIFSPTYGGHKTQRKHEKRHKKQEKKRKKLLGKEKKSGVDRLVQFLYDGSPNMSKARKPDKMMTGDAGTAHAWNNKATGRKILDWQKKAEDNQPNANMGQAGGMETGTTSTYPRHYNINSVGNAQNPRAQEWGQHKSYMQKEEERTPIRPYFYDPERGEESPEGEHFPPHIQSEEVRRVHPDELDDYKATLPPHIQNMQKLSSEGSMTYLSPTENDPAIGKHPQKGFVERTKDNPNEPPQKDAVVKENDMEKKIKSYDDKEEDTGHEQPAGVMAAVGMGHYPSGSTMQMSMAAGGINPDALERGGDKDIEDPEITEEDSDLDWVDLPEAEKKLESMRKALEAAGDENPILNALLKVDYA